MTWKVQNEVYRRIHVENWQFCHTGYVNGVTCHFGDIRGHKV